MSLPADTRICGMLSYLAWLSPATFGKIVWLLFFIFNNQSSPVDERREGVVADVDRQSPSALVM